MKKFFFLFIAAAALVYGQNGKVLTVEDLWEMDRIGAYDISPDGKNIVFAVTQYNMEANKGNSDIYLISETGGEARVIKNSDKGESEPKFIPGSGRISFLRDSQVWSCDIDGGNEEQITSLYSGVSGYEWSADGKKILFISSVYPECNDQDCIKKKDEEKEASKVTASLFTELFYRHWNEWRGDKRSHLFVYDIEKKEAVDLTLNNRNDVPPPSLGSTNDYSLSPDGTEAAYTMNRSEFISTSTNNDIFIISLSDGNEKKISISEGNDNQPVYSPDGKYIAYTSMPRAGFEADKQDIIIYERKSGERRNITKDFNLSAGEILWAKDGKSIFFTAANEIYNSIYKIDINSFKTSMILEKHINSSIQLSADGKTLFFKQQRSTQPEEIFAMNSEGGEVKQISNVNKDELNGIAMNEVETFWSEGAGGAKVQSILVKPPHFDSSKKYPMIFLIHGGPQGHWTDDFHYRWNPQMFAAQGYVVVAPNPRGSVGYGQQFTDEISGDWAGKVYTDLMNAYDHAIENYNFIDSSNTFAAGASYGGYMINWIAGHDNRFNALVSHAGVFNLESMYGATEELWFPEWEFKGTPWENRELYEKLSPHRYIHNAKTPVLVIHGANDFRVPEDQAFQLFTSLQRLGVESKFLYFPDEYHFITKPQNAKLWWNTVFEWFDNHIEE